MELEKHLESLKRNNTGYYLVRFPERSEVILVIDYSRKCIKRYYYLASQKIKSEVIEQDFYTLLNMEINVYNDVEIHCGNHMCRGV